MVASAGMIPGSLRVSYPWPESSIEASPYCIDLDGGGRFLVDRLIAKRQNPTLLEIGSFLGGSTLRWLKGSPSVEIVALDPWPDCDAGDFAASEEWWFNWPKPSEEVVHALNAKDGLYHTFLANLAPYKDRVVPVRGRSQLLLEQLAEMGLEPDLVYIDADKKRSDLDACFRLWPLARLTGDDYLWKPEAGYPMQQHVNAFAAEHGFSVAHVCQTWVLVPPG